MEFPILWLSGQRAVHTVYDIDVRFEDGLKYEIFLINSTPELWKHHFTDKNIQKQLTCPAKFLEFQISRLQIVIRV